MAQATTTKGGNIFVKLGSGSPLVYTAPCGFSSRSLTLEKNLEEVQIPDCDDPNKVDWMGRDATSLSMSVSGEGVLAEESVRDWLLALESIESVPVMIDIVFPAFTLTWTGLMQIESLEIEAPNKQRCTLNVSMQSDGEMVRVTTLTP